MNANAKVYELPTVGLHAVEIVSIKDVQATNFQGEPCTKVQFILLCTDQRDSTGDFVSICYRVNKTYFEKSSLTKFLAAFGINEHIQDYPLQNLRYATAQAVVEVKGTFANIAMIIPGSTKILNAKEQESKKKLNAEHSRQNQRQNQYKPSLQEVKQQTKKQMLDIETQAESLFG